MNEALQTLVLNSNQLHVIQDFCILHCIGVKLLQVLKVLVPSWYLKKKKKIFFINRMISQTY